MITIRKSEDRGSADRGWLKAYFTFSFADYYDSKHMGFSVLRVLNDDRIAAGRGFGPHAHRDMEIITYVLEGGLLHRDSTGENHILRPNEVQTMSAGSGIVHSEFNASESVDSHSIQIWILPSKEDVKPAYQQIAFQPEEKHGRFRLLAGPHGDSEGATTIYQDARLYVAELDSGKTLEKVISEKRKAWAHVVRGSIGINEWVLTEGDGAAITAEQDLVFTGEASDGGEFLFFDLP